MKKLFPKKLAGFTLMETVIAIGVLAVMLTAFMAVFGPATKGIRRSINVQEVDRLTSALEKEMATNRPSGPSTLEATTAFHKAYEWIKESNLNTEVIFAYQYRGNPNQLREDGTMEPYTTAGGQAGKDYVVQPMLRRRSDAKFELDIAAIEGRVFFVKMTQLVTDATGLTLGTVGTITPGADVDTFTEAVLPFTAEFFEVQTTDKNFLNSSGAFNIANYQKPIFVRNLAVRR